MWVRRHVRKRICAHMSMFAVIVVCAHTHLPIIHWFPLRVLVRLYLSEASASLCVRRYSHTHLTNCCHFASSTTHIYPPVGVFVCMHDIIAGFYLRSTLHSVIFLCLRSFNLFTRIFSSILLSLLLLLPFLQTVNEIYSVWCKCVRACSLTVFTKVSWQILLCCLRDHQFDGQSRNYFQRTITYTYHSCINVFSLT